MTAISEALQRLFANAEVIFDELSEQNEDQVVNSQDFLRKVMHDHQDAYIDLLRACQGRDMEPIHLAHREIGGRLRGIAADLGYEKLPDKDDDITIFKTPTKATVYRKR